MPTALRPLTEPHRRLYLMGALYSVWGKWSVEAAVVDDYRSRISFAGRVE